MGEAERCYRMSACWTGNLGSGTSAYRAYSRNHELSAPGKTSPVSGSSDPAFRGDPTRYNPEELLLGATAACHMLWVLHLCADAHIVVTEYRDDCDGTVAEHPDGSGEFTRITLRPRMKIADGARAMEAERLHHRAHELCAIARSLRCEVLCEPEVTAAESP